VFSFGKEKTWYAGYIWKKGSFPTTDFLRGSERCMSMRGVCLQEIHSRYRGVKITKFGLKKLYFPLRAPCGEGAG
jgi:hypothetical protein